MVGQSWTESGCNCTMSRKAGLSLTLNWINNYVSFSVQLNLFKLPWNQTNCSVYKNFQFTLYTTSTVQWNADKTTFFWTYNNWSFNCLRWSLFSVWLENKHTTLRLTFLKKWSYLGGLVFITSVVFMYGLCVNGVLKKNIWSCHDFFLHRDQKSCSSNLI